MFSANGQHAVSKLQQDSHDGKTCGELTVLFDGACPLCRREIGLYKSLTPLAPVSWLDVSERVEGLNVADQKRYMSRFHVRLPGGQLLSGAAAFVQLWLAMPGWHWLGRIGLLPGVTPLLEVAYRGFLIVRPWLQKLARRAKKTNA